MNDPAWLKKIAAREKAASPGPWSYSIRQWQDGGVMLQEKRVMVSFDDVLGSNLVCQSASNFPNRTPRGKAEQDNMEFIACQRTAAPLMRDMLRLLAEELGETACELARIRYLLVGEDQGEVGRRCAAVEAALAHYHDGTLPEKGESDEQETG